MLFAMVFMYVFFLFWNRIISFFEPGYQFYTLNTLYDKYFINLKYREDELPCQRNIRKKLIATNHKAGKQPKSE